MASSETLTLTLVPEAKFRRYSGFPQTVPTETNERYHVQTQAFNTPGKTNMKILHPSLALDHRAQKGNFFRHKGNKTKPATDSGSASTKSKPSEIKKDKSHCWLQQGEKISTNKFSWAHKDEIEDSNLFDEILKKMDVENSNKITVHRADVLESVIDNNDLEDKVNRSCLRNNVYNDFYMQEKGSQEGKPITNEAFKENKWQNMKFDQPEQVSKSLPCFANNVIGATDNGNLYNPKENKDREILGILSSDDFYRDNKAFVQKSPENTLKTKADSDQKTLNPKAPVNRRYASDTKTAAYRPSTSLDLFRRMYQNVITDNPVGDLAEKGQEIWQDIDDLISQSCHRRGLHDRYKGITAYNKQGAASLTRDNFIELQPRFQKQLERELYESCFKDRNKTDAFQTYRVQDREQNILEWSTAEPRTTRSSKNRSTKIKSLILGSGHEDESYLSQVNAETIETYPTSLLNKRTSVPADWVACKGRRLNMTTTLPRITPASTPLPTGITQPPPRSHSSASMYVPYPPKELSSSIDYLRIPGRINPLAPPPPRRRINWSWETTDQHFENEKRSLLMQKREHTRYHSAWSKAFYGSPAEKEAYRRHFREVLKQQMSDRKSMDKQEFQDKILETEQAISYDRQCREHDAKEYHKKHHYLMQYRDGNKQQMEDKWANTKYNKELENRIDRERLRYNPINWSCSLK